MEITFKTWKCGNITIEYYWNKHYPNGRYYKWYYYGKLQSDMLLSKPNMRRLVELYGNSEAVITYNNNPRHTNKIPTTA